MTDYSSPALADLASPPPDGWLPIREVARQTGVNPITLRAWERRYGLIRPTRTATGHRLYSSEDVARIRQIQTWIQRGVAVSKVADVLSQSHPTPDITPSHQEPLNSGLAKDLAPWRLPLVQAVQRFDDQQLAQMYGQILSLWPLASVFSLLLLPLWAELRLGSECFGRRSQWVFLDDFLRTRLTWRAYLGQKPREWPLVLLVAIPETCLELELLVAGALLNTETLNVRVLPFGQPFEELGMVCEQVRPQALVLCANTPLSAERQRQLERWALTLDCPVALVGEATAWPLNLSALESLGRIGPDSGVRLRHWLADQGLTGL